MNITKKELKKLSELCPKCKRRTHAIVKVACDCWLVENKKLNKEYHKLVVGRIERIEDEKMQSAMDGFMGRTRKCKFCHTPTEWDNDKAERYCPKGCFRGNKIRRKKK